jgi:hypothetical protein
VGRVMMIKMMMAMTIVMIKMIVTMMMIDDCDDEHFDDRIHL